MTRRASSAPTPTSVAGASSRRSSGAPTSSSPGASPTPRSCAGRRRGTTAGRATTGTRWPAPCVAGHVIECGTQATGGNYSFFTEVPGLTPHRLPVGRGRGRRLVASSASTTAPAARCRSAPSPRSCSTRSAARPTSVPTSSPASTPSSSSRSAPIGCGSAGTRGEPPPPTLKVAMNELGGYRNDVTIALTGLDIEAKAELVEAAFWAACPSRPERLRQRHRRSSCAPTSTTRPATRRPSRCGG